MALCIVISNSIVICRGGLLEGTEHDVCFRRHATQPVVFERYRATCSYRGTMYSVRFAGTIGPHIQNLLGVGNQQSIQILPVGSNNWLITMDTRHIDCLDAQIVILILKGGMGIVESFVEDTHNDTLARVDLS